MFLLLMGAFMGLVGWGLVLKKTGFAEATVQHGHQMQGDFQEAYGRPRNVTPGEDKARRFATKAVGWAFAVIGPVCFVIGVVRLITS